MDVTEALEAVSPLSLAESWDNVGLLVGDPSQAVTHALLAIDVTREVIDEATALGCELIVAYHPVIFDGLKRVTAGSTVFELVRRGIAVYSPHTALDVAPGGTNDVLAALLGISPARALKITRPGTELGLGRVGPVRAVSRGQLVEQARKGLGLDHVLVAGPMEGEVQGAAEGAGSCGDLYRDAIKAGAQFFLTGEMRHHDALRAAAEGLTVVCALHSNSERRTLRAVADSLAAALPRLRTSLSAADRDPFQVR